MRRFTRRLRGESSRSPPPSRVRFSVRKTTEHGFPHRPSAMAFDDSLSLLIIGTHSGHLKAYGRPGVVYCGEHHDEMSVLQILCHGVKRQVVTQCLDNYLYLWQLRDENDRPEISMVNRYRLASASSFGGTKAISVCCLPKGSPYLYIGTEAGNLYTLQIEGFSVRDNVVYWNHATAGLQSHTKLHPGSIVALEMHPHDNNKLLIGFEKGSLVMWNFKKKQPEKTFPPVQYLQSLCWHPEGKQFITSHSDGSFAVWTANSRNSKPEKSTPYDPDPCKRMDKVLWRGSDSNPLVVFSGGMPRAAYGDRHTVTVMQGASHVALDFSSRVIDFVCTYDNGRPVSLIVLLEEEVTAFDLRRGNVREIPRPYLCSLHESPLTAIHHCTNVPEDFWESLEHLAMQRLSAGNRVWPVTGGAAVPCRKEPSRDLIITGHEDGSVRFWDVSSCFLGPLYRLSLAALFGNVDDSEMEGPDESQEVDWPPFVKAGSFDQFCADQRLAVVKMSFCPLSRILAVGGYGGYVVLAMFNKHIQQSQMTVVDVAFSSASQPVPTRRIAHSLACKSGILTMKPGFQPQLCILCQPTMPVTNVEICSDWGLVGIGTSHGVALVDYFQKQSVLVKCTVEEDAPERSLWRFQSLRKSMRNSFRRLRSQVRRGRNRPQDSTADKANGESGGAIRQGQSQRRRRLPVAAVREQDQEDKEKGRGNGVRSLHFADTFAYGPTSFPSLWAGTMSGHLLSFHIHFPSMQQRQSELLWAEQTAKEYHLQHGAPVIQVVALDHKGRPMPCQIAVSQQQAAVPDMTAPHFALIVTEEQLKVISLPLYKLKYKHKVSDISADPFYHSHVVVTKAGDFYLACLTQKGEFLAYSIPELHLLHRCPLLDLDDGRAMHKFVFTENGQVFYMASPSQLQCVSLHADTVVEPLCTLDPARLQELWTSPQPTDVFSEQMEQSVESDQDTTNETFEHLRQSERDSPLAEEMLPNRKPITPSSHSDASLDDDVQEISIDVAIRAQTSWSQSHKSTPPRSSPAAVFDSNGHSESKPSVRTKSENGTILSPERRPGRDLTDYHKPVNKTHSEPPKQLKRSIFDHREQLHERGEKLEGVVKTSRQTTEKAQHFADKAAALVAQQERKPWWKT